MKTKTEQEHFGPFQDLIKTLNSSREVAPLQDVGSRLYNFGPIVFEWFRPWLVVTTLHLFIRELSRKSYLDFLIVNRSFKYLGLRCVLVYLYTQAICYWSLDLVSESKLKLEYGNKKIQYRRQRALFNVTLLKINKLLSIHKSEVPLKFGLDIWRKTNA